MVLGFRSAKNIGIYNVFLLRECQISCGCIPNSRNILLLQIFLKRAAKPSGNTSAGFPWIKWTWPGLASATFSRTPLTWLGFAPAENLLRNPWTWPALQPPRPSPEWLSPAPKPPRPPRPSPESSPEPSPEPCWTWPGSAPKPPRPSPNRRNLLRNLVEPDPAPAPVHAGAILGWRPH